VSEATTAAQTSAEHDLIPAGNRVEVRSRFVGTWSRGFEVAGHHEGRYVIKRLSDTSILPDEFDPSEVRVERHKHDFWWY
jgi:hypothetical protein